MLNGLLIPIQDARLAPYRKFTIEVFCHEHAAKNAVLESILATSDVNGCIGARCIAEPRLIDRADLPDIRELLNAKHAPNRDEMPQRGTGM